MQDNVLTCKTVSHEDIRDLEPKAKLRVQEDLRGCTCWRPKRAAKKVGLAILFTKNPYFNLVSQSNTESHEHWISRLSMLPLPLIYPWSTTECDGFIAVFWFQSGEALCACKCDQLFGYGIPIGSYNPSISSYALNACILIGAYMLATEQTTLQATTWSWKQEIVSSWSRKLFICITNI